MTDSLLARGLDQLAALLASVTPEDLDRPTPCSEWTVRDLNDHVVNSTAGMVTMAHGGQPDWANAAHHDEPEAALREQGDALRAALGTSDAQFPEGMAVAELAVHGYDLARSLGRDTADLDHEVAEAGLAFMRSSLTDDMRGGAFGPEQPAPEGADGYQRIAAFAGRPV